DRNQSPPRRGVRDEPGRHRGKRPLESAVSGREAHADAGPLAPDPHPGRQADAVTEARRIARAMARGGAAAVESSRGRLNDLNVYPVPDGDTGTNLAETARELAAGLESDPADKPGALASPPTPAPRRVA